MSRKNTRDKKRFFVCLTGMPGAGKSSVADSLKERGFYVIHMGDVFEKRPDYKIWSSQITTWAI